MTSPAEVSAAFANRVLDRCTSTNDLARQLGEQGAPHGTWVSAKIQERGRGRLGRQWQSLEGYLFLSTVARIEEKALWTWVPLTAAVAVARTLTKYFPELEGQVRIKWPNDLWLMKPTGGAKLGGILCEAVGNPIGSFIIIGLGVNCAFAPEVPDQPTASLSEAIALKRVTAEGIRETVIQSLHITLDELNRAGTQSIIRDYERWAALRPGQDIEWTHPSQLGAQGALAHGVISGLGALGELCVLDQYGKEIKLFAEDVRVRPSAN